MSGRRSRRFWRVERGFTLIEALVALVVLSLTATAALRAFGGTLRGQALVAPHLEAVALAEGRMNALALLPLDSVARYAETRSGVFPPPFEAFAWRALVRRVDGAPALLQAAVLVEWPAGEYTLETFFYRPELLPYGRRGVE